MGNKEELASYRFQLGQVNEALEKDAENEQLLKLQNDLKELITLYETLVAQEEPKESKPAPAKRPAPPPEPIKEKPQYIFEETKKTEASTEVVVGEVAPKKPKKTHSFTKKEKKVSKNDRIANVKKIQKFMLGTTGEMAQFCSRFENVEIQSSIGR